MQLNFYTSLGGAMHPDALYFIILLCLLNTKPYPPDSDFFDCRKNA